MVVVFIFFFFNFFNFRFFFSLFFFYAFLFLELFNVFESLKRELPISEVFELCDVVLDVVLADIGNVL